MAITPKVAALAVLLSGTAAGLGWAQTATPAAPATEDAATQPLPEASDTSATSTTEAAAPVEPASDAAAAPATPGTDAAAPAAGETGDQAADAAPAQQGSQPAPAASREAAQVGQAYVDSMQGDWTLRCIKAPEGSDPCELYQLLEDDKGNSVAEFSIIPLSGKAAAGATIVAPLETDLVTGLGFKVDTGKVLGYPFNFCAPIGCIARIGFTQAEVDALKRGKSAMVTLLPYGAEPEQKVDLPLSLTGFTAGMEAVRQKSPPPEAKTE